MSEKILSISVAAYNLGEMIEDNLKSFCDSGVIDDIEVLVINDESTDDTVKRAEKYAKKYPKSIKVIDSINRLCKRKCITPVDAEKAYEKCRI